MSDSQKKASSKEDADLQREIRAGRKFSLSEAIGRMAGPGAMKGISPISRKKQAENEIEAFLKLHLSDTSGALRIVLLRRLASSEHLDSRYDHPLQFLADGLRHVLASELRLHDVVTDADIEWGRITGERPFFEREGSPPHPDDPYTLQSVRAILSELLAGLEPDCNSEN
ncbi:MAG TPA: hypothetical protein PLN21_10070 [Gemmatales bacterium]|nr:hypothetical protein [Gemmatales bacterium]